MLFIVGHRRVDDSSPEAGGRDRAMQSTKLSVRTRGRTACTACTRCGLSLTAATTAPAAVSIPRREHAAGELVSWGHHRSMGIAAFYIRLMECICRWVSRRRGVHRVDKRIEQLRSRGYLSRFKVLPESRRSVAQRARRESGQQAGMAVARGRPLRTPICLAVGVIWRSGIGPWQ